MQGQQEKNNFQQKETDIEKSFSSEENNSREISLEDFKNDLTINGLENLSDLEAEKLYKIATTFANFAYKSYVNSRSKNIKKVVI